MRKSSTAKRVLLSIGMVASSSMAFAATSEYTLNALSNVSAGSSQNYAMLLAGVMLMATIARRRNSNRG